jgi:hypothetical protein
MFNSDDEIYQSINKLLIEQFGFPKKLSYETKINELAGDDAIEFIEEFSKKYNVDMSEFRFDDYFGPELGFNPIYYLLCLIFARHKLRYIPITVRDLVEIVKKQKWS